MKNVNKQNGRHKMAEVFYISRLRNLFSLSGGEERNMNTFDRIMRLLKGKLKDKVNGYRATIILTQIEKTRKSVREIFERLTNCLLYTSPSPRDLSTSRMPSSA